ncbi:MAG: malto-oligosyltrehalose trehalohydrolase [Opitutaceae bacterium]|jgi:maltooligosyltrehalose trehalohydrolase
MDASREAPIGATVGPGGVTYRLWAPGHASVEVAVGPKDRPERVISLAAEGDGLLAGTDPQGAAGDLYQFVFDGSDAVPDVASRFQPEGVFGPSEVIDPRAYAWSDRGWRIPPFRERVVYELHVGTFTPGGGFLDAIGRLDGLARLGVNTIELMPVADFPGRWNWGYDGVMLYAPARCYGRPEDLRALVDAAHARGLAVVLDVVYNHFGPNGNHLHKYTGYYYHRAGNTAWGQSFNFDGEHSRQVREFFIRNAVYWIDEFHFDGLRLDSTHAVEDKSPAPIFAEIAAAVAGRGAFTVAEDERNEARVVSTTGTGAWGADGVWTEDFYRSVHVALTGERRSRFSSYTGAPGELADIMANGWLFRGQEYPYWNRPRGTPCAHLAPERFVVGISNHDHVGNRPLGDRLNLVATPAAYRAASVLLCLTPYTPLLFMGQEWAASTPFFYFTDQPGTVGEKIGEWRVKELAEGNSADRAMFERMPNPQAESTFLSSKLRWDEAAQDPHRSVLVLYQACLALRLAHAHFRNPERSQWTASTAGGLLALRWRQVAGDWLLLVSLGDGEARGADSPLLQPRPRCRWKTELYSENPVFGGSSPDPDVPPGPLRLPGPAAWLLRER